MQEEEEGGEEARYKSRTFTRGEEKQLIYIVFSS